MYFKHTAECKPKFKIMIKTPLKKMKMFKVEHLNSVQTQFFVIISC